MAKLTIVVVEALFFFSYVCAAASDPVILSMTSQCVLFYDNSMPRNATQTIPTDQLPTASTTTTSSVGLVKTVVLTPVPSITTKDMTSTAYDVSTVTRSNNLTSTVYTSTVTVQQIPRSIKTYTATINETVSLASTTTVPAFPGYTPLGMQHPSVSARLIAEPVSNWAFQDEYWDKDAGYMNQEAICNWGWYATAVTCFATLYSASFSSTATIRRSIPAQTLTRTRFVEYTRATRTVWVSATPSANYGLSRPTISTVLTVTSSWATYIEATTVTSTARRPFPFPSCCDETNTAQATVQVYSSTATAYAACATDNTINSLHILQYDDLIHAYPFDQLRVLGTQTTASSFDLRTPNATSALACCAHAATEPNAWFYRFQSGTCNVWVGRDCPVANSTGASRSTAELWWAAQYNGDVFWRDDSMVVGNGACGRIGVVQPYWFRD